METPHLLRYQVSSGAGGVRRGVSTRTDEHVGGGADDELVRIRARGEGADAILERRHIVRGSNRPAGSKTMGESGKVREMKEIAVSGRCEVLKPDPDRLDAGPALGGEHVGKAKRRVRGDPELIAIKGQNPRCPSTTASRASEEMTAAWLYAGVV